MYKWIASAALAVTLMTGTAHTATLTGGFTEGARDQVVGTNGTGADATPTPTGLDLGTINAGQVFGLYGRIKQSQDLFKINFSTGTGFSILFDFDGYKTTNTFTNDNLGAVTRLGNQSGLMSIVGDADNNFAPPPSPNGKQVKFSLIDLTTNLTVATKSYFTNVNASTGHSALIFGAGPGSYTLAIDGGFSPNSQSLAFYDLNISTVPLPASAFFLLGALGGLAGLRRRHLAAS